MRFHVITLKTLRDLFSVKRNIPFLIAVMIVPFIASAMFANEEMGGLAKMTLGMQNQTVIGMFIVLSFMWMAGIPLVLLSGFTCGDFIAKEDDEGTLLLLVSKPVARTEIVLGKFLAFMISTVILQLIVMLLSSLIMLSVLGIDIFVFNNILSMIPSLFLYSIFVAFIFGAIATAFSSILNSRTKIIITIAGIAILMFFGFMVARGWMGDFYEYYSLYNLDVNYHLGNSYLMFVESTGTRIIPTMQGVMGEFTGTYDVASISEIYDMDIGAMPPELTPKDYYSPVASFLIWLGIAIGMLLLGIIKFNRKEIS